MTLHDIQDVSYEILKDIHAFCVQHDITYSLYGGTMIGAIRHQGFVPWDDDIDIAMPRPEYEKFVKSYQSEKKYRLLVAGTPENYLGFSRVCEMEETRVTNRVLPWTPLETGVWVDVFPLDGAPDDEEEAQKMFARINRLWLHACYARAAKAPLSTATELEKKVKLLLKKMAFGPLMYDIDYKSKAFIKACSHIVWGTTEHFANFSYGGYGMKEYQLIEDFESVVPVVFRDQQFFVCNGYDRHMKRKYGDYMQLPSKEQQVSNHELCKYYWNK